MKISNAGLAFNKQVFEKLGRVDPNYPSDKKKLYREDTNNLHRELFKLPLGHMAKILEIKKEDVEGNGRTFHTKELVVAWPGMMMGLGYGHGAKTTEQEKNLKLHPHETEIKTGFYFDFTSGIPVLPGSTVKGILRSYFPGRIKCKDDNDDCKSLKVSVTARITSIIKEICGVEWDDSSLKEFEQVVFEGTENGKSISSTEQDIFFDAFPFKGVDAKVFNTNNIGDSNTHDKGNNARGAFLGEDVLTPHDHPLRNPVPIKHLKILPGVTMRFQFLLNNRGGLDASGKEKLFHYLLQQFGAGARKGTGFGQFENDKEAELPLTTTTDKMDWGIPFETLTCKDTPNEHEEMEEEPEDDGKPEIIENIPISAVSYLTKKSSPINGTIVVVQEKKVLIQFITNKTVSVISKPIDKLVGDKPPVVGSQVSITINADCVYGKGLNCRVTLL